MKKQAIPAVPPTTEAALAKHCQATKVNLEIIMGQRGGTIERLKSDASTADIIRKINELIERLQ